VFRRWTVRDPWGRAFTLVSRADARAEESSRALGAREAESAIERLIDRADRSGPLRTVLLDLAGGSTRDARHHAWAAVTALVKRELRATGRLLLVPMEAPAPIVAPTAARSADRRLVETIMAGRKDLRFEGRLYRVTEAADWRGLPDRAAYQVVRLDDAGRLIARMRANPGATAAERAAFDAATSLLVDRARRDPGTGLLLLRLPPSAGRPTDAAPAVTPSQLRGRRTSIEITFLERGSGRPLAGVALVVTAPDGAQIRLTTTSDGVVKLSDIDPGQCTVTSVVDGAAVATSYAAGGGEGDGGGGGGRREADPATEGAPMPITAASIVDAAVHRIESGQTPESIAAETGVPWDTIARFNWDTTDPDRLDELFRDRLGCRKRTPDGKRFVFDDGDDPGIILIPRPWEASFAAARSHTVAVAPLRTVHISLENEAGLALPGARYNVRFADGSERAGALGRSGIARLCGVPDAAFCVSYADEQDLLARSLAASTRKAFDQQATGPLFFLLGQTQEIVDRAVAVYREYFDDLTGAGLAADIDQVVTDPDARPPLVVLCALAGLAVAGSENLSPQPQGSPVYGDG
jgi:hypothetical protein